jgi:methionine synthase / methylenetetrahydrofolate reductase(NADPH)
MSEFLKLLRQELVLGDGAIGTLLYQRGESLRTCYDALNLLKPDVIAKIHEDYLNAGAGLIETNTFGANRVKLSKFGFENEIRDINQAGAELAVKMARTRKAFVAGSVGPLQSQPAAYNGPLSPDELYREQMEALLSGGVDALFLESFAHVAELALAIKTAKSLANIPTIASLSFSDDGHTSDGFRINEAFALLRSAGADVVGLNCHVGPIR